MDPLTDPYGTAELRSAVLASWASSPTRFREDANAEDDLVRGGYRDRLVVELAQNAADAAQAVGLPGRLHLRVTDEALIASNTGQPLTRAGVESLASLRASAKSQPSGRPPARGGSDAASVGRFGVGFAAVLAVTDSPRVLSRNGGIAFSATATTEVAGEIDQVRAQRERREGHVPVLRLPFPDPEPPVADFDTTVVLPWRDEAARAFGLQALADVDASLLLALPALHDVVLDTGSTVRTLHRETSDDDADVVQIAETIDATTTTTRWLIRRGRGDVSAELVADLPREERSRDSWWWMWAVPLDDDDRPRRLPDSVPAVVHAPTPTDERVDLPALLMASFPLDASRRGIVAGPLTDLVAAQAAHGYADVVAAVATACGAPALALVPGPAGVGALDGRIRHGIRQDLPSRAVAAAADPHHARPVPGAELRALDVADESLIRLLADAYAGLVDAEWLRDRGALGVLGVVDVRLADVLDEVGAVDRPATWWHDVYDVLDELLADGRVTRNALDGLPVPLTGGRTVRGPRGAVVADEGVDPDGLADLGLRVVEPAAAHRLLERLGARVADASTVLDDPAVRARLQDPGSEVDPADLARAVLGIVAGAPQVAATRPWLRSLALPDGEGEWVPAGELLLPDAALRTDIDPLGLGTVARAWVDEFGVEALRAVGVVDDFAVLAAHDVTLDADLIDVDESDPATQVDGFADWADAARHRVADLDDAPPNAPDVLVVTDLDLVADEAWPRVLRRLAGPDYREAIVTPTRLVTATGHVESVPSYAAWWLSETPVFDGLGSRRHRPTRHRIADGDPRLRGIYRDAPPVADDAFLVAVGVRCDVESLLADPEGAGELLAALSDADHEVTPSQLSALYAALARWSTTTPDARWPDPPDHLRVSRPPTTEVVDRDECVVAVAPHHLPLATSSVIAGGPPLADLLGVRVFEPAGRLADEGEIRAVPDVAARAIGLDHLTYHEHDDLRVDGQTVDWWVTDDATMHAATISGLARALAWRSADWSRRWQLAALLTDPDLVGALEAEGAFDLA